MKKYSLIGIINSFSITPSFVAPVFKKDDDFYIMDSDSDTYDTVFTKIPLKFSKTIVPLHEMGVTYLDVKNGYDENDDLIGAFQIDNNELVIGQLDLLCKLLNEYITNDRMLKKEIEDFINNIEYYKYERKNKSR